MLEIIGAITGFTGAIVPSAIKYLQDKNDKKHELNLFKMQIKAQKETELHRMNEIDLKADIEESKYLYKTFRVGIKWIDALNGTVRPVIAYAFFILYAWTKVYYFLNNEIYDLNQIWTSIDNTIFLTIISFFYGQRAMQKIMK